MRIQTIRVVLCHDKVVTPMTVCSPWLGSRTSRHSIGGRSEQTSGSITLNLIVAQSFLDRDMWFDVRLWHLDDIDRDAEHVCFGGVKRTPNLPEGRTFLVQKAERFR